MIVIDIPPRTPRVPLVTDWFNNREHKPVHVGPYEVKNKVESGKRLWRKWLGPAGWTGAYYSPEEASLAYVPAYLQPGAIEWRGVLREE